MIFFETMGPMRPTLIFCQLCQESLEDGAHEAMVANSFKILDKLMENV